MELKAVLIVLSSNWSNIDEPEWRCHVRFCFILFCMYELNKLVMVGIYSSHLIKYNGNKITKWYQMTNFKKEGKKEKETANHETNEIKLNLLYFSLQVFILVTVSSEFWVFGHDLEAKVRPLALQLVRGCLVLLRLHGQTSVLLQQIRPFLLLKTAQY